MTDETMMEEQAPIETHEEWALRKRREGMVVSRFQARAALHQSGLLSQVQTLMDDPGTDPIVTLAWQDAQEFRRYSPTVAAMADALGLDDAQVDDLFEQATTIEA